ncbi:MAG: MFS transporter [Solirubrobacterales bacterium]
MRRPVWMTAGVLTLVAAGAAMMSVSMGARQTWGLLIGPLSTERGWPLATFSLAVALQNLLWGAFQPFSGAAADRWGSARVAVVGALAYALGLAMVALGGPWTAVAGLGVVSGLGIACTSFAVVLGAVGRSVGPESRSSALGFASAAGSLGMVGMIPVASNLIPAYGPTTTVWVLAVLCLASVPFAAIIARAERGTAHPSVHLAVGQTLAEALADALRHTGFRLLTVGFFVCGFQIAFIGVHLPNYLALCGMPKSAGATALLVLGAFNVVGTWLAGQLGTHFRPKYVLAATYLLRAVAATAFVFGPKTDLTMMAFAAALGMMWLSTVPLTSGLIASVFGPKHMGALFGIVFFSHQVGAFVGSWLGGIVYDRTLSYDSMWITTVLLGIAASLIHLPIGDRPLAERAVRQPA